MHSGGSGPSTDIYSMPRGWTMSTTLWRYVVKTGQPRRLPQRRGLGPGQGLLQGTKPRQGPASVMLFLWSGLCLPASCTSSLCSTRCSHSPFVGAASMRASKAFSKSSMLRLGASCCCPYFATSAGTQAQVLWCHQRDHPGRIIARALLEVAGSFSTRSCACRTP